MSTASLYIITNINILAYIKSNDIMFIRLPI